METSHHVSITLSRPRANIVCLGTPTSSDWHSSFKAFWYCIIPLLISGQRTLKVEFRPQNDFFFLIFTGIPSHFISNLNKVYLFASVYESYHFFILTIYKILFWPLPWWLWAYEAQSQPLDLAHARCSGGRRFFLTVLPTASWELMIHISQEDRRGRKWCGAPPTRKWQIRNYHLAAGHFWWVKNIFLLRIFFIVIKDSENVKMFFWVELRFKWSTEAECCNILNWYIQNTAGPSHQPSSVCIVYISTET